MCGSSEKRDEKVSERRVKKIEISNNTTFIQIVKFEF